MSLSKLSDSDGEMLIELRRNERSLWDVTSPHYSNARLARFLFLLLMLNATNEIVAADAAADNRARQLYKNISMLFLFPVPDVICCLQIYNRLI